MSESPSATPSVAATLALAVIPPVALVWLEPSTGLFLLLGAASWVVALIIKIMAMRMPGVGRACRGGPFGAVAWGFFSAVSELGTTAIFIGTVSFPTSLLEVIALGVGIGSIEIVYVFALGIREAMRGDDAEALEAWIIGARASLLVRHMLFVERISANVGHIGSRGLIVIAMMHGSPAIAVVSCFFFAAVDGVAIYGRGRLWNWCNPLIARRFYAFCFFIGIAEALLFALLFADIHCNTLQ